MKKPEIARLYLTKLSCFVQVNAPQPPRFLVFPRELPRESLGHGHLLLFAVRIEPVEVDAEVGL